MSKILISYFSMGGTTEKISKEIARGLEKENCRVDFNNITENKPVDITSYDAIGIGFPVYIFRIPFNVKDFIKSLPDLNGKPFFVFILYGSRPGNPGTVARKMLTRKGGREIGYMKYTGTGYFLGYQQQGYLFSPDHPVKDEMDKAYSFGRGMVQYLNGAVYETPEYDSRPGPVYTLERMITIQPYVKYFYRYFFNVDKKKCNQCRICITNCPVKNISMSEKGYPQWGGDCIVCWFCEMYCPKEAIKSPIDWPIMKPFMKYNVSRALRDPSLDHVRVKLLNGKVERI